MVAATTRNLSSRPTSAGRTLAFLAVVASALLATPRSLVRGQEAPLFNATTIVDFNASVRTDFCDLHRKVESGEIRLRHALKGASIRPGIFRYQLEKETGRIDEVDPPIAIKMLDEIARRAQFTWRDSYGVVDSPNENQTWSEVLDWTVDTYDIMGDWYLRTTERLADGMLFPEKWYDGSLIMIRKTVELDGSFQWRSFLQPFTDGVWALIVATTLASGLAYYAIDYIGCDGDKRKMENTLGRTVFDFFLTMTGQYVSEPVQPGNCILAFSTCLLFLIILATYTANLASFLVIRNTPDVVITEIQDVLRNDLRLCVMDGTAAETFMRERFESIRLVEKENIVDSYLGLDERDCDVALTTIDTWQSKRFDIVHNEDCRKEWVGRVVQKNDAGFTLRDSAELCSSLLRDVFSLHLMEMKRDKTFQTIWDTERAESANNNCEAKLLENNDDDFDEMIRMGVQNVGGVFIVHAVFTAAGLALALLALCRRREQAGLARREAAIMAARRSSTPPPSSPHGKKNASPRSMEATTNTASATSFRSEESEASSDSGGDPEGAFDRGRRRTPEVDYVAAALRKQTECMESMQKQMDAMQRQLTKLAEQKRRPQTRRVTEDRTTDDAPSSPHRIRMLRYQPKEKIATTAPR